MKIKFHKKVLKNGMTVIFEKRNVPTVSIGIAIRCGGINESESEKGISHFIEHMLFKGTATRSSKQISEEVEKNGGVLDGSTGEDLTTYMCKIPDDKLFTALDVLADLIKNPLFDDQEINKERKVIFEEIKMDKDDPIRYSLDTSHGLLYEKPFGLNMSGTYKTINSINRKKLLGRFKESYRPSKMILCVVGNAKFDKIIKFANKNFQDSKGKVPIYKIRERTISRVEKRKGINQANIIFSYHSPLYKDSKKYAAIALISLMAHGMSSRLFNEIREKRNLAYAIVPYSNINKDFSYSRIYVGTSKENVETVKKLILKEFKKVSENLTENELKKVKDQIVGNHKISIEDSFHQLNNLLYHESQGKAEDFYEFEEKVQDVKLKDVKDLAKIKKYSFFALIPSN